MNKDRETPVRIIIVRKKGHGGGHHGGARKVAFADFMTAMFALFLVLWLVTQSSDIKSAIAGYFQDPLGRASEFGSSIMPGEGAQSSTPRVMRAVDIVQMRRDRLERLAKEITDRMEELPDLAAMRQFVEIELTDEGLRIQLIEDPDGVFFETGRPTPSPRGQSILALLGTELGKLPNAVLIEGHTDARPYSGVTAYSNWELSADRANTARRIMVERGLATTQVSEIRGHADRKLKTPEDPFAAANRRVSITVLVDPRLEQPVLQAEAAPAGDLP